MFPSAFIPRLSKSNLILLYLPILKLNQLNIQSIVLNAKIPRASRMKFGFPETPDSLRFTPQTDSTDSTDQDQLKTQDSIHSGLAPLLGQVMTARSIN